MMKVSPLQAWREKHINDNEIQEAINQGNAGKLSRLFKIFPEKQALFGNTNVKELYETFLKIKTPAELESWYLNLITPLLDKSGKLNLALVENFFGNQAVYDNCCKQFGEEEVLRQILSAYLYSLNEAIQLGADTAAIYQENFQKEKFRGLAQADWSSLAKKEKKEFFKKNPTWTQKTIDAINSFESYTSFSDSFSIFLPSLNRKQKQDKNFKAHTDKTPSFQDELTQGNHHSALQKATELAKLITPMPRLSDDKNSAKKIFDENSLEKITNPYIIEFLENGAYCSATQDGSSGLATLRGDWHRQLSIIGQDGKPLDTKAPLAEDAIKEKLLAAFPKEAVDKLLTHYSQRQGYLVKGAMTVSVLSDFTNPRTVNIQNRNETLYWDNTEKTIYLKQTASNFETKSIPDSTVKTIPGNTELYFKLTDRGFEFESLTIEGEELESLFRGPSPSLIWNNFGGELSITLADLERAKKGYMAEPQVLEFIADRQKKVEEINNRFNKLNEQRLAEPHNKKLHQTLQDELAKLYNTALPLLRFSLESALEQAVQKANINNFITFTSKLLNPPTDRNLTFPEKQEADKEYLRLLPILKKYVAENLINGKSLQKILEIYDKNHDKTQDTDRFFWRKTVSEANDIPEEKRIQVILDLVTSYKYGIGCEKDMDKACEQLAKLWSMGSNDAKDAVRNYLKHQPATDFQQYPRLQELKLKDESSRLMPQKIVLKKALLDAQENLQKASENLAKKIASEPDNILIQKELESNTETLSEIDSLLKHLQTLETAPEQDNAKLNNLQTQIRENPTIWRNIYIDTGKLNLTTPQLDRIFKNFPDFEDRTEIAKEFFTIKNENELKIWHQKRVDTLIDPKTGTLRSEYVKQIFGTQENFDALCKQLGKKEVLCQIVKAYLLALGQEIMMSPEHQQKHFAAVGDGKNVKNVLESIKTQQHYHVLHQLTALPNTFGVPSLPQVDMFTKKLEDVITSIKPMFNEQTLSKTDSTTLSILQGNLSELVLTLKNQPSISLSEIRKQEECVDKLFQTAIKTVGPLSKLGLFLSAILADIAKALTTAPKKISALINDKKVPQKKPQPVFPHVTKVLKSHETLKEIQKAFNKPVQG